MKWLYKLEYKHGNKYIPHLMTIVVAGMAVVYLFARAGAASGVNFVSLLTLDRAAILKGQVWRLITFIFVPTSFDMLFLLISLYFYYMLGKMLESYWGGFRLNIYYLTGMLCAIISTFIVGHGSSTYLNLSLFLALATIAPDMEFRLFFILPVKAKWLALFSLAGYIIPIFFGFLSNPVTGFVSFLLSLVSLAFALLNYLLYFGPQLFGTIRENRRIAKNRKQWQNRNK